MPEGLTKSVMKWDFLGMRRRKRHIIVRRFPWQLLDPSTNKKPSLEEFNRWISWSNPEIEIWVEWHKVDDPPIALYTEWLHRCEHAGLMSQFKTLPRKDDGIDIVPEREYTRPGLCYDFVDARHRDEWLSNRKSRTRRPKLVQYEDIKEKIPIDEEDSTGKDAENDETDASEETLDLGKDDLGEDTPSKSEEPKPPTREQALAAIDFSFLDDHIKMVKAGGGKQVAKKGKNKKKGRKR